MSKYRDNNIKHFVEYNACYITKKTAFIARFIYVFLVAFATFIAIKVDIEDNYGQTRINAEIIAVIKTYVIIIAVAALYLISAVFLPTYFRRLKGINELEELLYSIIWYCILGMVAIALFAGLGFIYTAQGTKAFIISIFIVFTVETVWFLLRKRRIEDLIDDDGFNKGIKNVKFDKFDRINRSMWETPAVVSAPMLGFYYLMKHSGYVGIVCFGLILELVPIICIDVLVCCLLQIKFAREYDMQEHLPIKSRRDCEKGRNVS